jgi:hypothetical protein
MKVFFIFSERFAACDGISRKDLMLQRSKLTDVNL